VAANFFATAVANFDRW